MPQACEHHGRRRRIPVRSAGRFRILRSRVTGPASGARSGLDTDGVAMQSRECKWPYSLVDKGFARSQRSIGNPMSVWQRPLRLIDRGHLGTSGKVYSLQMTRTSARIPRTAINPAMIPNIEYGMVAPSAFSVFISCRC